MMEGTKYDKHKIRLDLLPVEALIEVGQVLTHGANKYGDRNWETGINYSRLFGASLRHLFAWWMGEDVDKESGRHHLAHAACCILFVLQYEMKKWGYAGYDDRPMGEAKGTES